MDLKELLKLSIQQKASDLHLTENSPPVLRIDGKLVLTNEKPLIKEELKKSIYAILTDNQKEKFERDKWPIAELKLTCKSEFTENEIKAELSRFFSFEKTPEFKILEFKE